MRLFVAIRFNEGILDALEELQADLLQGGLLLCCALVLLCLVLYARDFLTLLARKDGNAPRIL